MIGHRIQEPDFEAVVIGFLKLDPYVTAVVDADMISGKLRRQTGPESKALRVRRLGGVPTEDVTAFLGRARVQIDAFAPVEADAYDLAARAFFVIHDLPDQTVDSNAVITAVSTLIGPTADPDPASDLERYRFDLMVYGHGRQLAGD